MRGYRVSWRLALPLVMAFVWLAGAGRAAPPVRPPVRVPEVTPARPSSAPRPVTPLPVAPSARGGPAREEGTRFGPSLRPMPVVPFRSQPGGTDKADERGAADEDASSSRRGMVGMNSWLVFLLLPVAGALTLIIVVMLAIDRISKRRGRSHSAISPAAASHINPRWSPSPAKRMPDRRA